MNFIRFTILSALGTYSQHFMPTRDVESLGRQKFPQGGLVKFSFKGRFLILKKALKKFFY